MPRRRDSQREQRPVAQRVLDPPEGSILDLLDHLLDKGVMANGDVTLGVAGVDLIYLRLASILCASDRVLPRGPLTAERKSRKSRHRPSAGRSSR